MVFLKNQEEINLIKEGADILGRAFGVIARAIKPGIATKELDKLAEEFITDHGGRPSFKGHENFPASICASVNDGVVHCIPNQYKLQEADIISVDCGVYYKGFHSDSAFTFPVGEITQEALALLRTTKESLYLGIDQAIVGNRIGDIGQVVQDYIHLHGYTVVRELAGHGIGKKLHEQPDVPNYGKRGSGMKLQSGMVIAIEPMVNLGRASIRHERDSWTIRTLDGKLSAHFEHTVVVREDKAEILTTYQYIEEALKQ